MERPALVMIDVQREYFSEASPLRIPDGPAVLARLEALLDTARARGVDVVHVRHEEDAGSDVFAAGTANVETMPEVGPQGEEPVVVKSLPGAFDGTELDRILEERDSRTVVIAGFMTHMCCDTTAREAHARGYDVVFLTDGTATRDLDGPDGSRIPHARVHETVLAAQADGFSTLMDVEALRSAL